jgi:glycosyltransferase involved in cell wall biosynthesis
METSFSVVIATYNCRDCIGRCLDSVLAQTHAAEILVVDNCSEDGTADIVARYADRDVRILVERDKGVFDAWNKGIDNTKGDWIIFLGADDAFATENALAELAEAVKEGVKPVVYGTVEVVDQEGNGIRTENTMSWEVMKGRLDVTLPFTHVGTAHHRSLFTQGRKFDPSYRIAGDYAFLYRELTRSGATYVPQYAIRMQLGGLSTTLKNRIRLANEVERVWREEGAKVTLKAGAWMKFKKVAFRILLKLNPNIQF